MEGKTVMNTYIFAHSQDGFSGDRILEQNVDIEVAPVFCNPFSLPLRNLFIPNPFQHPIFPLADHFEPFEEADFWERFCFE